jgi:hypothetical protein
MTAMMATGEEEVEGEVDVEEEREGRRGRGLFSRPCNSKLVSSSIVTIFTLHLFRYLYLAVLLLYVTKGNKSFKIPSTLLLLYIVLTVFTHLFRFSVNGPFIFS